MTLGAAKLREVSGSHFGDDKVGVSVSVGGRAVRYRCDSHSRELCRGGPAVVARPFEKMGLTAKDATVIFLRAPAAALVERAGRLTLGASGTFRDATMADHIDLHTPSGGALERVMKTAMAEICALDSAGLAPFAIAAYEDLLLSHAAVALFPAVTAHLGRPVDQVAPAILRRARDYIRDHAAEPIRLSNLAVELGVPSRTLEHSFRAHFGLSPQAWRRQCRLEIAWRSLTLPDGATTVSAVAELCGFGNLGDFSVQYREKYGQSPSDTLRSARQRLCQAG